GRRLSPDPAGMGAANSANPQSWNRYAYVGNNPLANIDPLGMDLCTIPPSAGTEGNPGTIQCPDRIGNSGVPPDVTGGGGNCTMDGAPVPCGIVQTAMNGDMAVQCPNNDCGARTGDNGYLYQITYIEGDGWNYINPKSGDTFGEGSELGLPSLTSGVGGQSANVPQIDPMYCDSGVIGAMKKSWSMSSNGTT